jgi:hypothetical protein
MIKSNNLKIKKHHVFISVFIFAVASLWAFFIHPNLARGVEAPTGLQALVGSEQVRLSWDEPNPKNGIPSEYVIYYSGGGSKDFLSIINREAANPFLVSGLTNNLPYIFYITAIKDGVESEPSEQVTATPIVGDQEESIAISSEPVVVKNSTSANIVWNTTTSGSSAVYYGPTEDFSGNTPTYNDVVKTTDHSVDITGLTPCAGYWFKVVSYDDLGGFTESSGGVFKTSGCKGDSEIITYQASKVTTDTGATVEAKVSSKGLGAVVPANLKAGISEMAVEALKLEKDRVIEEISTPSGREWVGAAYSLKVFETESDEFDGEFDNPVDVTIDYTVEDVAGLDTSTLKIYHYTDGIGWEPLSNCSTNTDLMKVTCQTTSFSIFGLFGSESVSVEVQLSSTQTSSNSPKVQNTTTPAVTPVVTPTTLDVNILGGKKFEKNISQGEKSDEVKTLQMFLNNSGFTLALSGPGSKGNETNFFGPLTVNALIKFQEFYKNEILVPLNLTSGTGYFGQKTREFINSLK